MATSARLEELLQKFGENPRRYFAPLANEHRKLGDLEQAIALCRTHLPQQPQHVSGHIVLAQALFEAGNTPEARDTFELALDLDPENLIALRYLGDIARAHGDHPTARQWYERVLEADPRNDEIARLVRELENGAAVTASQPATAADEAPAEAVASTVVSELPNADIGARVETAVAEPEGPVTAATPPEDLATAWQHEVSALESESHFEVAAPLAAEPEVHESQPIDIAALAPDEEAPAAPFAESAPVVEEPSLAEVTDASAATEATDATEATVFTEIDYSIFEAVADDEEVIGATPRPSDPEPEVAPVASSFQELLEAEAAVEQREAEPAVEGEPEEAVEQQAASTGDDWFAMPNAHEEDAQAAEVAGAATFDLDAAFQSVLPNAEPEEEIFVSQAPLADFEEAAPVIDEWSSSAAAETPLADEQEQEFESSDNVEEAFAALDRMTESLEADIAGNAMLLPDEEYVVEESVEASFEVLEESTSAIARTPEMGVPAVEPAAITFVTETMAELYLQQGFREEALAVYRQLLTVNPDDAELAARVRSLEGPPQTSGEGSSADETAPIHARADSAGQSMRAFLGVFARRRAPMRRRDPAKEAAAAQPRESGLSALFGGSNGNDDGAAAVLAGAFAQPNAESLPGRPTRAAAAELSLGDVFGGGAATATSRAATFDEFFSAGHADHASKSPLDEEGSDMEQFTAWLEGLKKK